MRTQLAFPLLLSLLASTALPVAGADLHQEVRGGPVLQVVTSATPEFRKSAELFNPSDLIVVGEVVDQKARLSDDALTVFSDYTVQITRVIVGPTGRIAPGQRLVATTPGGHVLVDGVAVEIETLDFPPIPWLVPHLFFLRAQKAESPSGLPHYGIWGGPQGVWELLPDGRIQSHHPNPVAMRIPLHFNKRTLDFLLKEMNKERKP